METTSARIDKDAPGDDFGVSTEWAHASWDNAGAKLQCGGRAGRRGGDRRGALDTRERVARGDREKANLRV
jgi:hypothetical protein